MADYIYLLETRLSKAQRTAIDAVRDVARSKGLTIFLVGGAVRDLTSGSPVRDLDLVVQGNALKLKKDMERAGATLAGENDPGQALYLMFPGGVRMEFGSTLSVAYPKPGKPVVKVASLLDDLRRRDFTANAMALSLNEGSYGLLMDPLNGVADIENRELRLVSNYGFIEDPARMIRAARLMARLGWQMEDKTQARYETGKQEGYISALSDFHRGYETEEIFHEEDPLRVMRRLDEEGWMQHLFPPLTVSKANAGELERLREAQMQLQMQGIVADAAAANFPLLTAKLTAAEVAQLKQTFPRTGFVSEINSLDAHAKDFTGQMVAKTASMPSQTFQLLHRAQPEAVLWAAHTSKSAAFQAKLKSFQLEWPQARQRIPYSLMQEMRIVPDLPQYAELVEKLFYELMDGKLSTVEEMKAFLEPYSPPAPPPPVHLRRARSTKKEAKGAKGRKKVIAVDIDEEDDPETDADESRDIEDGDKPEVVDADEAGGDSLDEEGAEEPDEVDETPVRKTTPAAKTPIAAVTIVTKHTAAAPALKDVPPKSLAASASARLTVAEPVAARKSAGATVSTLPEVKAKASAPTDSRSVRVGTKAAKMVPVPDKVASAKKVPTKAAVVHATASSGKAVVKARPPRAVLKKKSQVRPPLTQKSAASKRAKPLAKASSKKNLARPTKAASVKKSPPPKKAARKR